MPNYAEITNVAKEQIATKPKGLFRRVGSYLSKLCGGKAEKEVAECKGKSLQQIAEHTSNKERVQFYKDRIVRLQKEIETSRRLLENARKRLEEANHDLTHKKDFLHGGQDDFTRVPGDCYGGWEESYGAYKERINGYKQKKAQAEEEIEILTKKIGRDMSAIDYFSTEIKNWEFNKF